MNTIIRTEIFDGWLSKLRDTRGKARIFDRIRSAERGNFGDCVPVGEGVSEMRIHSGPGYRVCFTQDGCNLCSVVWWNKTQPAAGYCQGQRIGPHFER